jgi:hypothetical protein
MKPSTRRSAALLISIHVDPESASPWYARLYGYERTDEDRKDLKYATTIDDVCEAVRTWLESLVSDRLESLNN